MTIGKFTMDAAQAAAGTIDTGQADLWSIMARRHGWLSIDKFRNGAWKGEGQNQPKSHFAGHSAAQLAYRLYGSIHLKARGKILAARQNTGESRHFAMERQFAASEAEGDLKSSFLDRRF